MNQFDQNSIYRSCQKLLSAVVALAIEDAQLTPIRIGRARLQKEPRDIAITAVRFLFTDDSDGYLVALNIDPKQFRKRLMDAMYSKNNKLIKNHRAMIFNYHFVYKNYSSMNWDSLHKEYPSP